MATNCGSLVICWICLWFYCCFMERDTLGPSINFIFCLTMQSWNGLETVPVVASFVGGEEGLVKKSLNYYSLSAHTACGGGQGKAHTQNNNHEYASGPQSLALPSDKDLQDWDRQNNKTSAAMNIPHQLGSLSFFRTTLRACMRCVNIISTGSTTGWNPLLDLYSLRLRALL